MPLNTQARTPVTYRVSQNKLSVLITEEQRPFLISRGYLGNDLKFIRVAASNFLISFVCLSIFSILIISIQVKQSVLVHEIYKIPYTELDDTYILYYDNHIL